MGVCRLVDVLFGNFELPLHWLTYKNVMNVLKLLFVALLSVCPACVWGTDYFDVVTLKCSEKSAGASYEAWVDVPVGGGEAVVREAKRWICEVLGVDEAPDADADAVGKLMETAARDFLADAGRAHRTVKVTWAYEDPSCVTFEAEVADHDSVVWTTADVATFSKRDGHRVSAQEVFACDEAQIKRLMWRWRGDAVMEVSRADDLYVGNVGYIDGWVIVIGPAQGTSGAEFRIRYSDAEKWLRQGSVGYLP